jgi:hypothetical protein
LQSRANYKAVSEQLRAFLVAVCFVMLVCAVASGAGSIFCRAETDVPLIRFPGVTLAFHHAVKARCSSITASMADVAH